MKPSYYEKGLTPSQKDVLFLKAIKDGKLRVDIKTGVVYKDDKPTRYSSLSRGNRYHSVVFKLDTGKYIYIPRARLVWLAYTEKPLEDKEIVLHRSEDTEDDSIDNLMLGGKSDTARKGRISSVLNSTNRNRIALSLLQVRQIRYLRKVRGVTLRQIAAFIGCSKETVFAVSSYATWKDIADNFHELDKTELDTIPISLNDAKPKKDKKPRKEAPRKRSRSSFDCKVPDLEACFPKTTASIKRIVNSKQFKDDPKGVTSKFVKVFKDELKVKVPPSSLKALFNFYHRNLSA